MLLLIGITSVANAQTSPKNQAPKTAAQVARDSQTDYCLMQDGHMMTRMKDGQTTPMAENMTMSNGTLVKTDGTCTMPNGTKTTMKNGQCVMMNGKMTTTDALMKGSILKHGRRKGAMKM